MKPPETLPPPGSADAPPYVDAKVWDSNPAHDDESRASLARLRARCHGITNVADMRAWLDEAVAAGMDPL